LKYHSTRIWWSKYRKCFYCSEKSNTKRKRNFRQARDAETQIRQAYL